MFGYHPGRLNYPNSIRLLGRRPAELIVADTFNNRLCVFGLNGQFVKALGSHKQGLHSPCDMLECNGGFLVANDQGRNIVRISSSAEIVGANDGSRSSNDISFRPAAFAALPDGGLVMREYYAAQLHVFRGLGLRMAWIAACVLTTTRL